MSSPRNKPGLLSGSGVRLSAFYAALLTLAFAATALVVRFSATAAAESALRQKIELEADALAHELDVEGVDAVKAAIAARVERPGAPEYWLADASGRRLIGDAPALEGPNGWRTVDRQGAELDDGAEGAEELIVLTRSLPNGMRLSVGEDLAEGRRLIGMTMSILAQAGAASVALALLAGVLATRRSLRRLDDITLALEQVGAGRLDARVPSQKQFFLSDLERVSEGINQMFDRNETLVGGLRRVTRDVAHDLRTPLAQLRQRLEQARESQGPGKDQAIASAEEKAAQIVRTFDAILRLAEIEAGSAITRFKPVDLKEIAETIGDAYRPDAELSGRTIAVDAAGPVLVDGDRELLTQAVANLVENALKHTPTGAAVTLCVEPSPAASISVADTGGGIPAEELDAVLEPYYRRDQSRTTSGAGLGLAIVKAVADLHDADLRLETFDGGFRATIRSISGRR